MPSSSILSLTGGSETISRVIGVFTGAALRGRTTETLITEPGCPARMPSISASDISRVLLPSIASMMSPSQRPALSAGPPGMTETTAAYPKRFESVAPMLALPSFLRCL